MDVAEAIRARKSIRAFKPDPVPRALLTEMLETAIRAPSWANSQPWDFYIAAGDKLEAIRQGFTEKAGEQSVSAMDVIRPQEFPEPYASRRRSLAPRPSEGAPARTEPPGPRQFRGPRFFGAPCLVYICTGRNFYFQSKGINAWPLFDCGLLAENLMLPATSKGLGSVALAQSVTYPDVLRKVLEIPDPQIIILGIAIGYPDWENPINQRQSVREPLSNVAKWCGLE